LKSCCRSINAIHVAAILTKLANITKAQPTQQQQGGPGQPAVGPGSAAFGGPGASSSSLQEAHDALVGQLQALLKAQRCHGHCPRGLANIIWALGKMHDAPNPELMLMLLRRFFGQLATAVPQDIANVLWGIAEITRDHGLICPPSLQEKVAADDTAASAGGSSAQQQQGGLLEAGATAAEECAGEACGISSTTAASDAATPAAAAAAAGSEADSVQQGSMLPLLSVQQVQQLLQRLCGMLGQAAPQTISNITCALCVLQHCHRWCMCSCLPEVRQLVTAFVSNIHESLPSHIHKVVKCLTQMALACAGHAGDSWISWQPPLLQVMLSHLAMQRRTLKQVHIVSVLRDITQLGCLFLPLEVTTEVAATSAAAAAAAAAVAAEAEVAQLQQQQEGGAAAAAGTADAAAADGSSTEEARKRMLLALAAVAAAVDEVLDVKALEDVDDDSGLPPTSAPLAAAAAAAARARAAAAAAACVADATAPPATPPLSGSGAPSSSSSSSSITNCVEPDSPGAAYVRSLVAGMFARLTLGADEDDEPSPFGSPTAIRSGAAADCAEGEVAAAVGDAATAAAVQLQPKQQVGCSSNATVLEKLLPQLERLGLLQQYNILRNYANSQGLIGGNLLGRQYTYPGAGSNRPGQHSGGSGFITSDVIGEAQLARHQAMSWQQQQQFGAMQQQPRQQRWWEGRQQQQQGQGQGQYGGRGEAGMYGGAGMGRRRVDVLGQVMEAGVYRADSPTAYGTCMPPGRVFVPGPHNNSQQQQQHQMMMQGGVQPPPPPPQQQQQHYQQRQQQQLGPGAGAAEFMGLTEAPSADISMISPFQSTASAAAAAAAAATAGAVSKPLGSLQSSIGISASSSVSTVPSQLMPLSSRASSNSSSCYTHVGHTGSGLGSSVTGSVESTGLGSRGYGLTPAGSSGGWCGV
jgi:hypothetical protein